MNWITTCVSIIFLKTFMLHFTSVAGGSLTVSSRLALAVCEQRDSYSTSKKLVPPIKKLPPPSTDLTCGWFRVEKCPDCKLNFKTCAQVAPGSGNTFTIASENATINVTAKGARTAGKFRNAGSKIDPSLLADLQKRDGSPATATIIINMEGGNDRALKSARSLSFKTREDRIVSVAQSLQALAKNSQLPVLNHIEKTKARLSSLSISTLWISNQIVVEEADLELVQELAKLPQVSRINPDFLIPYSGNTMAGNESESEDDMEGQDRQMGSRKYEGWHIKDLDVAAVWKQNVTGAGVVLGTIGMGARGTHKGLKGNFRSDHGWFDVYGSAVPIDKIGWGTGNLGAMVTPLNNLGVAPGAQWIACKPFLEKEAYYKDVVKCCQFMLCPTDPKGQGQDCKKAPHVVHSSFNVNSGQGDFTGSMNAWRGAGIVPVFGAGNVENHAACSSLLIPADYDNVFTVGALVTDDSGTVRRGDSTAKGPNKSGKLKPEVIAPGNWIQSVGHNSDDELAAVGGTNPAGAQVAGLMALLLSIKKDLSYANLLEILTKSAQKLAKPMNLNCGGIPETTYPNNIVGYGKVNAVTAVKYLRENFGKPPPATTTTTTTAKPINTTTTTMPPGPSLPPPKFSCYIAEGCADLDPKREESSIPECVIVYLKNGKLNFHAQKYEQGKCDKNALSCKFCYISKCNSPRKYCNKTMRATSPLFTLPSFQG